MIDPRDPLLPFLAGEVKRIEQLVDSRLPWPDHTAAGSVEQTGQLVRWSYRFTWQEVERGRRYVMPLPINRAIYARRSVWEETRSLANSSPLVIQPVTPRITYRARLNSYEVSCAVRAAPARR